MDDEGEEACESVERPEWWDPEFDAELDAVAESMPLPGPPPVREWTRPVRVREPREYDRRLAVLTADAVGEFLRACRASAGLSQRDLAEAAGVPRSTVGRVEAGHVEDVKLSTIVRLAEECDVILVGTTGSHAPMLETDLAQRHTDRAGRMMPAHLFNLPYLAPLTGDDSWRVRRGVPRRTYRTSLPVRDVPDE
ncbi:helix-turn-helix domain-containing protein [Jatrophihabitans sp. YIM 134969]